MLKIRLRRAGKKNTALYRVVVAEKTSPIQGKFIDLVGTYNPHTKAVVFDNDKLLSWLEKGAQASNTIAKLMKKQKITHKNAKIIVFPKKAPKKKSQEADKTETPPAQTEEKSEPAETAEPVASEETPQNSQENPQKEEQDK